MGKDVKALQNFFLKNSRLSLSPAPASSSFVGRFSFFCFILVLHSSASFCIFFGLLLLLRAASSSSIFFFFFAFLLLPHLRCHHCCRDQVEASSLHCCFFFEVRFSFAFLLLPPLLPAMAETAIGKLLGSLRIT